MTSPRKPPLCAVLIGIPEQEAIINKVCFGSCGKILCAGVDLGPMGGGAFLCAIPAADCPAFMREMDEPMGEIEDGPVYLRRLQVPKP